MTDTDWDGGCREAAIPVFLYLGDEDAFCISNVYILFKIPSAIL